MKTPLNSDGTFKLEAFEITLDKIIQDEVLELVDVKEIYENYDEKTHKPVGEVVSITYTVFSPDLRGRLNIKVDNAVPVIAAEELRECKDDVYIQVPLTETFVRPYKVEFNKVSVTVKAPTVHLVRD